MEFHPLGKKKIFVTVNVVSLYFDTVAVNNNNIIISVNHIIFFFLKNSVIGCAPMQKTIKQIKESAK